MNYEALGRCTHLKQQRQEALHQAQALAASVLDLWRDLEHYRPPYPGADLMPQALASAKAAIPQIEALLAQATDQWDEMQRLKAVHNLPD